MDLIRDKNGKLPARGPGGYPIVYTTKHGNVICRYCANDSGEHSDRNADPVEDYDTHMEGPPWECDECGYAIESAYGGPGGAVMNQFSDRCECEHEAHFPETEHADRLTYAGHAYGAAPSTHAIKTPYGTFARCDSCAAAKHMEVR